MIGEGQVSLLSTTDGSCIRGRIVGAGEMGAVLSAALCPPCQAGSLGMPIELG
jgi:hypothetical protein